MVSPSSLPLPRLCLSCFNEARISEDRMLSIWPTFRCLFSRNKGSLIKGAKYTKNYFPTLNNFSDSDVDLSEKFWINLFWLVALWFFLLSLLFLLIFRLFIDGLFCFLFCVFSFLVLLLFNFLSFDLSQHLSLRLCFYLRLYILDCLFFGLVLFDFTAGICL